MRRRPKPSSRLPSDHDLVVEEAFALLEPDLLEDHLLCFNESMDDLNVSPNSSNQSHDIWDNDEMLTESSPSSDTEEEMLDESLWLDVGAHGEIRSGSGRDLYAELPEYVHDGTGPIHISQLLEFEETSQSRDPLLSQEDWLDWYIEEDFSFLEDDLDMLDKL